MAMTIDDLKAASRQFLSGLILSHNNLYCKLMVLGPGGSYNVTKPHRGTKETGKGLR